MCNGGGGRGGGGVDTEKYGGRGHVSITSLNTGIQSKPMTAEYLFSSSASSWFFFCLFFHSFPLTFLLFFFHKENKTKRKY